MDYVQNYLGERLSEADRDAFEERLSADPMLVRELEATLRLREGLATLRDQGELVTRASRRVGPTTAAAACAVLALIFLWIHSARPSPPVMAASLSVLQSSVADSLSVSQRFVFATLRAASAPPSFDLPAGGVLELQALTAATDPASSFRMRIERREANTPSVVGSLAHLAPDADGFVVAYVVATALKPGDYILVVEPDVGDASVAERFAFAVKKSPAI